MSIPTQAQASDATSFRSILSVIDGVYCKYVDVRCVRVKPPKSNDDKDYNICTTGTQDRFDNNLNKIKRLIFTLPTLLDPSEPEVENDAAILAILSELAEIFLCKTHIKGLGIYVKYQWFYELRDPETAALIISILDSHTSLQSTPDARSEKSNSTSPFSFPLTPPDSPEFDSHTSASRSPTKAAYFTERVVEKNLRGNDLSPGFFYVGFHPECHGLFHVGYTTRDPKTGRFPEHEKCYPGMIWITEEEGLSEKAIKYVHRVEQIILNMFARERKSLREKCRNCRKVHGEWLEVEKSVLLHAITEWSAFVGEAYDEFGKFDPSVKRPALAPRASRVELEIELEAGPVTPCKKPSLRETLKLPPSPPETPDTMPGSFIEDHFDEYEYEDGARKSKGIFSFDPVRRVLRYL